MSDDHDWNTTTLEYGNDNNHGYDDDNDYNDDDDNGSAYSLDYEFPGPRFANTRKTIDDDQEASDLSDTEEQAEDTPRFDMWEDDPYSDFTWESNDMQLTRFMKRKLKQVLSSNFSKLSFWKKEKGWPRQLPYSSSSTNHEQSANAICLVQSNYGLSEQLYAVYRDRIIQCGKPTSDKSNPTVGRSRSNSDTTSNNAAVAGGSGGTTLERDTTYSDRNSAPTKHIRKFLSSNQSISLSKIFADKNPKDEIGTVSFGQQEYIKQFKPYTKFIKREDFLLPEESYMALSFDPQCLAQKYGYMAIGGVEGEFELYCCIDPSNPVKIWGTKFKGKDNVMLMTNAIQLVRWQNTSGEYNHMLISCMNEAGLLFYHLPSHNQCNSPNREDIVKLHSHQRSFHGMPINDAKLSPDGTKLVCVGDDYVVFMIDVYHCATKGEISFDTPIEIVIPPKLLLCQSIPYSSQYVAWSPSSKYFAHTSDSHNVVLIWRTSTREILYSIDAAGYTYAISFHPHFDHILVFTNRYGYFHTVDLSKATTTSNQHYATNILTFDHQTQHQCLNSCVPNENHAVFHTRHLHVQHEITMIAFRGEINIKLRILAKINGIEWSKDGKYLYVATKKRVLAFKLDIHPFPSLLEITGLRIRKLLETQQEQKLSRKRIKLETNDIIDWSAMIPDHVRSSILGSTQQMASH